MMVSGNIKQRFNRGDKKPQGDAQPSKSWSSKDKFDLMMKMMEKMMEIMTMENIPASREQHDPIPEIRTSEGVRSNQTKGQERKGKPTNKAFIPK
jgi:hypothetical protein